MATAHKFTVALVQMRMGADRRIFPRPSSTFVKHEAVAKVVCLPELFRAQYFCQREDLALFDLAEQIPGPSTAKLAEVARESKVTVIASLFERRARALSPYSRHVGRRWPDRRRLPQNADDPLYYEKEMLRSRRSWFSGCRHCGRPASARWFAGISGIPKERRITALQGAEVLSIQPSAGTRRRRTSLARRNLMRGGNRPARARHLRQGLCSRGQPRWCRARRHFWSNRIGPRTRILERQLQPIPSAVSSPPASAATMPKKSSSSEVDRSLIEETRRNWPFLRDRRVNIYAPITQRFLDPRSQAETLRRSAQKAQK